MIDVGEKEEDGIRGLMVLTVFNRGQVWCLVENGGAVLQVHIGEQNMVVCEEEKESLVSLARLFGSEDRRDENEKHPFRHGLPVAHECRKQ